MPTTFHDNGGHHWTIHFDGLTLAALKEALGINLADIAGDAYEQLETDQSVLTRVVCFLCREQLEPNKCTQQQLANLLSGEIAELAMCAIWEAAQNFFRPKLWSALTSVCNQRKQTREQWSNIA